MNALAGTVLWYFAFVAEGVDTGTTILFAVVGGFLLGISAARSRT